MTHDIIRLKNVTVAYGNQPALTEISAHIHCGGLTAIVGPNGAGKSTLLRAILGWLPLSNGEIRIGDAHPHHALPRLAYLPQRAEIDWDFPITVRGVVEQGRYRALGSIGSFKKSDHALVDRSLLELGIADLHDRQIRALSGGQQQRMFLARALAQGADIFLLDEPFASLDAQATEELAAQLSDWISVGRTVVASVHDIALARRVFSDALLLNKKLVAHGPTHIALSDEHLAEAGLQSALPLANTPLVYRKIRRESR